MPQSQRVVRSMQQLSACLTASAEEMARLSQRADQVSRAVASGRPLAEVIEGEPRPLIISRMTELLDELADTAGEVRRAEAAQLNAEGLSQYRIAKIFGVTRQRVSALLSPPPPPDARAAKRPRKTD